MGALQRRNSFFGKGKIIEIYIEKFCVHKTANRPCIVSDCSEASQSGFVNWSSISAFKIENEQKLKQLKLVPREILFSSADYPMNPFHTRHTQLNPQLTILFLIYLPFVVKSVCSLA